MLSPHQQVPHVQMHNFHNIVWCIRIITYKTPIFLPATEAELLNCGPQSIIDLPDKKTITCITFDSFGLDGNFIASNGVYLENYGVVAQPNCGVDSNCGRFSPPSRLQIPRFTNADFFELTVSLWFKGTGALVTNGVCSDEGAKTYVDACIVAFAIKCCILVSCSAGITYYFYCAFTTFIY